MDKNKKREALASVGKAYDETIDRAEAAFLDAIALANEALAQAKKTNDEAIAQAMVAYREALNQAEKDC